MLRMLAHRCSLLRVRGDAASAELRRIQARALVQWRAGYDFHQQEVRADPSLLAWVRQEDYL
jgi:hypothetical protein